MSVVRRRSTRGLLPMSRCRSAANLCVWPRTRVWRRPTGPDTPRTVASCCRVCEQARLEWQDVAVGDPFRLHPDVALRVARVEPRRSLVLRGAVPLSETAAPPYDFSWAFVLNAAADGSTRLIVRERYRYTRRWGPLLVEPVQLVSFVMSSKMLRGIRGRAEGRRAARARRAKDAVVSMTIQLTIDSQLPVGRPSLVVIAW